MSSISTPAVHAVSQDSGEGGERNSKVERLLAWLGGFCFQPGVDRSLHFPLSQCDSCFFNRGHWDKQRWHPYKTGYWKDLPKQMSFLSTSAWLTGATDSPLNHPQTETTRYPPKDACVWKSWASILLQLILDKVLTCT